MTATTARLSVDSGNVIATGLKPSDDGKAVIVRLWECAGRDTTVHLHWSDPQPAKVWLSDTGETPLSPAGEAIAVPAWGLVTLRAEMP